MAPRLIIAACCGALAFFAVTDGGARVRKFEPMFPTLVELARKAGLGLEQVTVTGNANTSDTDVFDALELRNARTFFSLDISAGRKRIEDLPWVKTASITRVFPSQLRVKITERVPVAVWLSHGRGTPASRLTPMLIDATGRVLGAVPTGYQATGLLRLRGAGAAAESTHLMVLLSRHAALNNTLALAERVAERRWSLHMKNLATIDLPAEGIDAALRRPKVQQLLAQVARYPNTIIDLRTKDRVSVRPREAIRRAATLAEAG